MSIDYGRGTDANRNPETGIRYGIIPRDSLPDWVHDEAETHYDPACPNCGCDLDDGWDTEEAYTNEQGERTLSDCETVIEWNARHCPHCDHEIVDGDEYPDEPSRTTLHTDDGVVGAFDNQGDLWVFRSKVTAKGSHCSPCAPGAVYHDGSGNVEAYAAPLDWWDDDDARRPYASVEGVHGNTTLCNHEPADRIVPPLGNPLPTCKHCGIVYMPDDAD